MSLQDIYSRSQRAAEHWNNTNPKEGSPAAPPPARSTGAAAKVSHRAPSAPHRTGIGRSGPPSRGSSDPNTRPVRQAPPHLETAPQRAAWNVVTGPMMPASHPARSYCPAPSRAFESRCISPGAGDAKQRCEGRGGCVQLGHGGSPARTGPGACIHYHAHLKRRRPLPDTGRADSVQHASCRRERGCRRRTCG